MNQLTKYALKQSLSQLLRDKPLSKITISELVERCGVGRNTFYYHYEDIYMLLDDIINDDIEVLKKDIDAQDESMVFSNVIEYFITKQRSINHVQKTVGREKMEEYLGRIFRIAFEKYAEKYIDTDKCEKEEIEFIIDFMKYAFVGITMEWISHDYSKEMATEYKRKLEKYLNGDTFRRLLYK